MAEDYDLDGHDDDNDNYDPTAKQKARGTGDSTKTPDGAAAQQRSAIVAQRKTIAVDASMQLPMFDGMGQPDANGGYARMPGAPISEAGRDYDYVPNTEPRNPAQDTEMQTLRSGESATTDVVYDIIQLNGEAEAQENIYEGIDVPLDGGNPGAGGNPGGGNAAVQGRNVPWIPIGVVLGLVGTAGIGVLIWGFAFGGFKRRTEDNSPLPPLPEMDGPSLSDTLTLSVPVTPGAQFFDVLGAATKGTADLDPKGVFLRFGEMEVQSMDVGDLGVWEAHSDGRLSYTPKGTPTRSPLPVRVFVRDKAGLTSNTVAATLTYTDLPRPATPPFARDAIVPNYGGVSASANQITGKPVVVDVTPFVSKGDPAIDIDPKSVLLHSSTRPTRTPGVEIEFEGELKRDGEVVGYTKASVQGEGVWSVDRATGEITFTPDQGFTRSPSVLTYSIADVKGHRSNVAQLIVNGQIAEIREAFDKLANLSDDDFWKTFKRTVIDKDYDLSVVYAVADVLLTATRAAMSEADERAVFGIGQLGLRSLRVPAQQMPALMRQWANGNVTSDLLLSIVERTVTPTSLNNPTEKLAVRGIRLDLMTRMLRNYFSLAMQATRV